MTIGTAIVIVMLLYLLDKHGLLKRAAGIVAVLAMFGLAWIFGQQQVQKWLSARYIRHHAEIRASLIKKYQDAVPPLPAGYKLNTYSVPLDELESQTPRAKNSTAKIPELDPSQVEWDDAHKVVLLDEICKEPQWAEMEPWERSAVLEAVTPKMDYFDRRHFEDRCQ